MLNVLQQFLIISRILAGIFSAANSSSKFGWYPAKPNFLRRIFVGEYNFGEYGEFSAALGLSWPGLTYGIDYGATTLQPSSPEGAKVSKSDKSLTVGHIRGSEPQMCFNYPGSLYVVGKGYEYSVSCVKISFCRSFTYLKKNGCEYCWAKSKNMTKNFDPKNF